MSLGARLVGREYEVRLCYSVEHRLSVKAGVEEEDAIMWAEEKALHGDVDTLFDRDLVHTEVEATREIFEDDPDAFEAVDWIDGPTSPSEETYWDDSRHFGDCEVPREDTSE